MNQRVPPQAIDVERTVLGSCIIDRSCIDDSVGLITDLCFFNSGHKEIYRAITEMYSSDTAVDIITLSNYLKSKGKLESVGGDVYLAELSEKVSTTGNVKYYCDILIESAKRRMLIDHSNLVIQKSYDNESNSTEIVEIAEKSLVDIHSLSKEKPFVLASEMLSEVTTGYDNWAKGEELGLSTGLIDLDYKIGGLYNGDLIIIAGRPGMGKSSLGLNIANHLSLYAGKSVLFFSLEMSNLALTVRTMCADSRTSYVKARRGRLDSVELAKWYDSANIISKSKLIFDDTAGISPNEMKAKAQRCKRLHGLDLIVIDYLQLIDLKQKTENRQVAVATIARQLKVMAKYFDVPVIALSQLNRVVEGKSNSRPGLSDLRESGAIEQDSDMVIFIYRDDYYKKESEKPGIAELDVAKQRNGPLGPVEVRWSKECMRFENLEKDSKQF